MTKRSLCLVAATMLILSGCAPKLSPQSKGQYHTPTIGSGFNTETVMGEADTPQSRGVIPADATPIKVALLVPLSGQSENVGKAMMDAANMALYDSYLSVPSNEIRSQVVLLPKDTGSTAAEAGFVAKQAVSQGAKFIIGPLFSQSVKQVQPIIKGTGVKMLAFSNTKEVARPDTFIFGFLPEQQVKRMADYAFLNNYTRVALLAPNNMYGQRIQERLVSIYSRKGGLVKPIEQYAPSPTNIDAAVGRIAAFNDTNKEQGFQAIFIADGGSQLRNIISSLKKTNVDLKKIKLLGTGMWDDPSIAKIPEMHGAWFSSSPPQMARSFERRFKVLYGYKPIRLASLAYDAVSVIVQMTMRQADQQVDMNQLTHKDGFMTPANGLMRFNSDGTNERKLAIIEVTPAGFKVVDRARDTFRIPGEILE